MCVPLRPVPPTKVTGGTRALAAPRGAAGRLAAWLARRARWALSGSLVHRAGEVSEGSGRSEVGLTAGSIAVHVAAAGIAERERSRAPRRAGRAASPRPRPARRAARRPPARSSAAGSAASTATSSPARPATSTSPDRPERALRPGASGTCPRARPGSSASSPPRVTVRSTWLWYWSESCQRPGSRSERWWRCPAPRTGRGAAPAARAADDGLGQDGRLALARRLRAPAAGERESADSPAASTAPGRARPRRGPACAASAPCAPRARRSRCAPTSAMFARRRALVGGGRW